VLKFVNSCSHKVVIGLVRLMEMSHRSGSTYQTRKKSYPIINITKFPIAPIGIVVASDMTLF
jgi:hypothetical protein